MNKREYLAREIEKCGYEVELFNGIICIYTNRGRYCRGWVWDIPISIDRWPYGAVFGFAVKIMTTIRADLGSGSSSEYPEQGEMFRLGFKEGIKHALRIAVTRPEITKVVFNDPATIVYWSDNTKTVVKCQKGDKFDPEKGLAMAITKKHYGNTGSYCDELKKWLPKR